MWGERFWDELLEFILRTQNHRSPAAGGHVTHLSSQNLLTVWCQSSTACWGISTWTEACRPTNPTSTGAEAASVNNNVSEPAVIIRRNSGCCFWFQTGGLPHVRSMANVSAVSLWGVSLVLLAPWFHFSDTLTSMKNENTLLHRDCGTVPLLVCSLSWTAVPTDPEWSSDPRLLQLWAPSASEEVKWSLTAVTCSSSCLSVTGGVGLHRKWRLYFKGRINGESEQQMDRQSLAERSLTSAAGYYSHRSTLPSPPFSSQTFEFNKS